jgi:hypothetical protein
LQGGEKLALYKVVFLGLAVAGPEEEARLLAGIRKSFNLSPEKAERLLQRVPIVVKKGIPKEEMERYVRVFESFGGKVRVEEEPVPVTPDVSLPPEPEKKIYSGRMITCPQCGFEQPEKDECSKCGLIISKYQHYQEMAHALKDQVHEISTEDKEPSPWESGEGFIWAFLRTTREVLFSPTPFFRKVAAGEGYWPPLIYGLIAGIIGWAGSVLWQWVIFSRFFPMERLSFLPYSLLLIVFCIALPFMVGIPIFIGSAVLHLCLMIVGGNRKEFQMTFRVVSYSWGGYLFGIVPFIGGTIGWIYALILAIIGIREAHGISSGKAVLAVFLPIIVVAGLGILAAILIPMLIGTMRFSAGAGV